MMTKGQIVRRLDELEREVDDAISDVRIVLEATRGVEEVEMDDWMRLEHLVEKQLPELALSISTLCRDVRTS